MPEPSPSVQEVSPYPAEGTASAEALLLVTRRRQGGEGHLAGAIGSFRASPMT